MTSSMVYKVRIAKTVDIKLSNINEYCIRKFNNYDYGYLIYRQIVSACDIISSNPKIGIKYTENIYKLILSEVGYNLYYSINDDENIIYIEDIMSFKESSK